MANLADLLINLKADPSGIEEGMSRGKKLAAAGGAAMAAAIGASALEAMDISAATDKLAAQLGLTEADSARVGGVAGDLFANAYGENIAEVNTAVGAVMSSIKGMADASSDDLEGASAKALDFATTFEVDVQRAVDVAGRAMSSGLASDFDEAFDLITAASQRVPANLREDVLDATDEYGQFFASIGLDGPQAFAVMVDAAEKGMFGIDKIGDAVKEFTILSTDGSKSTAEAFDAIGLNAKTMQNSILAGGDSAAAATQKIVDGLLGIKDPGKQAETALALFGTPIEDLNVKDIPEFLKALRGGSDAMAGFSGAADRMGVTLNDNAKTNFTAFKRQVTTAVVDVLGGQLIPILDKSARWLASVLGPAIGGVADVLDGTLIPALKAGAKFMADNEGPIKVVATVIGAMLVPALIVLGVHAVQTTAKVVAGWVTQSAAAVKSAASSVAALTRVAMAWVRTGVQAMASAARIAAAWLLSMGPIAIVIAAVAGLVVLIVKYWDEIKAAVSAAAKWVWGVIKTVFSAITGAVTTYAMAWVGAVRAAWDAIKGAVRAAVGFITGAIRDVVSTVKAMPGKALAALGDLGSMLTQHGLDFIAGFINGIVDKAKDIPGVIKDKVVGVAKSALHGFGLFGSPSRLTFRYGEWWTEGFVNGMKAKNSEIDDQVRAMVDRLKAQVEAAKDFARGIRDAFRGTGDITGFSYGEGGVTRGGMLAELTRQAEDAENFNRVMKALRAQNLNATTFDQLLSAGPDSLADAQKILHGGRAVIADVNALVGRIDRAGMALGGREAKTRYGVDPYGAANAVVKAGAQKVRVELDVTGADKELVAVIRRMVRERGGDVQVAFGR